MVESGLVECEKLVLHRLTKECVVGIVKGCRWTRRESLQRCLIIEFGNLDVRGELIDLVSRSGHEGEFTTEHSVIRTRCL